MLMAHGPGYLMIEIVLIVVGALVAILSVLYGWRMYTRHGLAFDEKVRSATGGLYRLWEGRYFWDEFYQKTIVKPLVDVGAKGMALFDGAVIDGAVNGLARTTRAVGAGLRMLQTGVVQAYALAMVVGVVLLVALLIII